MPPSSHLIHNATFAATVYAVLVFAWLALAHHGWSCTEDGLFELKGIVTDIYIGNPHATTRRRTLAT